MTTHEQVAQDLPLYALGTLADEDRRCVQDHLRDCARCRFELHLLREDMNRLSLRAPEIEFSDDRPAGHEMPPMITLDSSAELTPPTRLYWLASIPVILCVVLGAMVVQLRTQNQELTLRNSTWQSELATERSRNDHARMVDSILRDPATIHMVVATSAQQHIQVLFNPNLHRALAVVSQMTRPDSPYVYQVWLKSPADSHPISAGIFLPDPNGNAFLLSPELPNGFQPDSFDVTTEVRGGAPAPTAPPVFSGK